MYNRLYTGTEFEQAEEWAIDYFNRQRMQENTKMQMASDFVQAVLTEMLYRGVSPTDEPNVERCVWACWKRLCRGEQRNSWTCDSLDKELDGTDGITYGETIADKTNVAEDVENRVYVEQAEKALDSMFDGVERDVARLYIKEGLGIRTIAEQLEISVWTARKTLDRVKSRLHQ